MIRTKQRSRKTVIDLTGPQGNAFFLLGTANKVAKQLGLSGEAICNEMKTGDYENLIEVFDKYFGDYFILER